MTFEPIRALLREFAGAVPAALSRLQDNAPAGSRRSTETSGLRATRSGGGKERAGLLDEAHRACLLMCGHTSLVIDGIEDCLTVAEPRDGRLNSVALALLTRAFVESASEVYWLLDRSIDGTKRARRTLIWQAAQLRNDRQAIGPVTDTPERQAAEAEMGRRETAWFESVQRAKFDGRPRIGTKDGMPNAALLTAAAKPEEYPAKTHLVEALTGGSFTYRRLSASAHGRHSGIAGSLQAVGEPDRSGRVQVAVTGMPLSPGFVLLVAGMAVKGSTRWLVDWNGQATDRIDRALREAHELAGRVAPSPTYIEPRH